MFIEKTVAAIIIGFCLGGIGTSPLTLRFPILPHQFLNKPLSLLRRKLAHTTERKPMKFTARFILAPEWSDVGEMNEVLDAVAIVELLVIQTLLAIAAMLLDYFRYGNRTGRTGLSDWDWW